MPFPAIAFRILLLALLTVATTGRIANGQSIDLSFDDTPLEQALTDFSERTDTDVVYSGSLVRGRSTSCAYRGDSVRDALLCIVAGHPVRIEEVSPSQFVLVPVGRVDDDAVDTRRYVFSGFVMDAESGESLIGAHVLLPEFSIGAVTNDAGYFALPGIPGGNRRVRVSFVGFRTVDTLLVVGSPAVHLRMRPGARLAGDILIEESAGVPAEAGVTPGLVSVPIQQLGDLPASLGGQDVFEELRWMPGIHRAGEATGGLVIRGSGTDQNLYLIDGAPVYHPWHAFSLISTFQTETFKNVSLYRGAFPAEYGGRLSSVLDAELRDGGRSGPRVVGAVSALSARFVIESPVSRSTSFMLSGRRSYIDRIIGREHAVSDDLGRRDTLRTGYHFYDWSGKITYRPSSRSTMSVSYYTGRDVLDLRLPFDLSLDFSSWLHPADLFFEVDQDWGNRLLSLRHQVLLSDRLFLTTTVYDSRYSAREAAFVRPTNTASVVSDYGVDLEDFGAGIELDWYAGMKHHVRAGMQSIRHRFNSDIEAAVTYTSSVTESLTERSSLSAAELAVYVQDDWRPTPRWRLLPGLRASWFSRGDYLRVSPRFNARYAIVPGIIAVRGSAATQVQYMQRIRDRYSFLYDLVSSRWIPTDENTEPSRSGQLTAGLELIPTQGVQVTLDAYTRRGRNILLPEDEFRSKDGLIGPGIEVSTLLGQYLAGEERSSGVEAGLDLTRGPWRVVLSGAVSESESRITQETPDDFRPTRFDIPLAGSAVVQWSRRSWTAGVSGIWRSGYP
ncbi:MAG: TonB-dependent receptor, partial [Rhodothermales bacterium]|nr:TonB-dependent receptor [Rhodothermales bacterium]